MLPSGPSSFIAERVQIPCLQAPCLRAPCLRAPCLRAPCLRAPCLRAPCLRPPCLRAPCLRLCVLPLRAAFLRGPWLSALCLRTPRLRRAGCLPLDWRVALSLELRRFLGDPAAEWWEEDEPSLTWSRLRLQLTPRPPVWTGTSSAWHPPRLFPGQMSSSIGSVVRSRMPWHLLQKTSCSMAVKLGWPTGRRDPCRDPCQQQATHWRPRRPPAAAALA